MKPFTTLRRRMGVHRVAFRLANRARRLARSVNAAVAPWRARSVLLDWIWHAGLSAASALGLVAGTEVASRVARGIHLHGPGWQLDHRISPDAFETFIATTVGSLAAFLALFFTTLGVVAATAYANAPGEVRAAFLGGRQSAAYVRTVVRALVSGLVLLAVHAVGYHPYSLSVLLFAVLALLSVLGSAALGVGLFGFFDLATLAEPLPRKFLDAVVKATVPANGPEPVKLEQSEAHNAAKEALRLRRHLLQMIAERAEMAQAAPTALFDTTQMWALYASHKPAIPSDSSWFPTRAQEPNWLTVNPFEPREPVTGTPLRTTTAPDRMWIERELIEHYVIILRPLVKGAGWEAAMRAVEPASQLAGALMAHLNLEEALLLCQAVSEVIDHAADAASVLSDMAPDQVQRRRFRIAAVEAGSVVRNHMWHGLLVAADRAADPGIGGRLERAARAPNHPDAVADLPISLNLRAMLDAMSYGLAVEREAEGHEISPDWWLRHLTANTLARALYSTTDLLLADLHEYITARHTAVRALNEAEALITLLLSGLEAVDRAAVAVERVEHAGRLLAQLQRDESDYEPWPTWEPDKQALVDRRNELLRALGPVATKLPVHPHTGEEADLLGRSYHVISQALFDAVVDGEHETASILFPAAMHLAFNAHARATADVREQPLDNHLIRAMAPLIDMMLISGYTLFFHKFDGKGIWPQVRDNWDKATATSALARTLIAVLEARHTRVPGDVSRHNWQEKFDDWLSEHGLTPGSAATVPRPRKPRTALDPVVTAVLGLTSFKTYLMADLFRFAYLAERPGGADIEPGPASRALLDKIGKAQRAQQPNEAVDHE